MRATRVSREDTCDLRLVPRHCDTRSLFAWPLARMRYQYRFFSAFFREPPLGIEPRTLCLRSTRSATELLRLLGTQIPLLLCFLVFLHMRSLSSQVVSSSAVLSHFGTRGCFRFNLFVGVVLGVTLCFSSSSDVTAVGETARSDAGEWASAPL